MAIPDEPEVAEDAAAVETTTPRTRRKQDQVPRQKLIELRAQVLNEGSRGLLLINGIMAIALGILFHAILYLPTAGRFLPFILAGMGCAAIGVLFAALIFIVRYFASFGAEALWESKWGIAQLALILLSILCFAGSVAVVLRG